MRQLDTLHLLFSAADRAAFLNRRRSSDYGDPHIRHLRRRAAVAARQRVHLPAQRQPGGNTAFLRCLS